MPLRAWVRKYNNVLRVQVEGEASMTTPITDMVQATAAVDRPEHENLFVGDEVDNYLPMASANHMTGNPWYSTECCAALGQATPQTFQDADHPHAPELRGRHHQADLSRLSLPGRRDVEMAGLSQLRARRVSPTPGARAIPSGRTRAHYNDYLARNQQTLTQGDAKTDVAVYMQNYLYPPSQGFKYRLGRYQIVGGGLHARLPEPDDAGTAERDRDREPAGVERPGLQGADHRQRAGPADRSR